MRHVLNLSVSLILIWCTSSSAHAQFPLHYRIDHTGKVQLCRITGTPHTMSLYRLNDPLALLPGDSSCRLRYSKYNFDRDFNHFRNSPSDTGAERCTGYDFSQHIEIGKSYFTHTYPAWEDHHNPLFHADIIKGKYLYEHRYIHYTPEKANSMPPPGPASTIPARYTPVHVKWLLDSSYRISKIVVITRDSNTSQTDSSVSSYEYTGHGEMRKVTTSFNADHHITSYLFYTDRNDLRYIVTLSKDRKDMNEKDCDQLLSKAKSLDDLNSFMDTIKVLFFAAYQYDAKQRVTSCTSFDITAHGSHLLIDSVHYNTHHLPDTIDSYLHKQRDAYGSRIVFLYDSRDRISKTIENASRQWFRNFKSEVAHLEYNSFLYNSKGRIVAVEKRFGQQRDIRTVYEYEER